MRTLAPKKLLRTVVLTVSALVMGLFHPGLAEAQSSCPAGFKQGTDRFGVQGCINVGYQCPPHGSWSVRDNKCDCLPQWPVWDDNAKQCFASSCPAGFKQGTDRFGVQGCINVGYRCPINGSWSVQDNKCDCLPQWPVWNNDMRQCTVLASMPPKPLGSCPQSVTYWEPEHVNIKDWCGVVCPDTLGCILGLVLEKAGEIDLCLAAGVGGGVAAGVACTVLTTGAEVPHVMSCESKGCHCGCLHSPIPQEKCKDAQGRNIC